MQRGDQELLVEISQEEKPFTGFNRLVHASYGAQEEGRREGGRGGEEREREERKMIS